MAAPNVYIPPKDRGPRYPIFNVDYLCRVPAMAARSPEEIEMFGTPASSDEQADATMLNERILTYLTIGQMVEYFAKGIDVGLVTFGDSKKIYHAITGYLTTWKEIMDRSMMTRGVPIDDLILLDEFANSVYEHAKYQIKGDAFLDNFLSRVSMRVTRDSILGNPDAKRLKEEGKNPDIPERDSMASVFAAHKFSMGGQRRWGKTEDTN